MAEPDAVRESLSQHAAGTDPDRAVVEAACEAMEDVERAAGFVEQVGVVRLSRAVERLRRRGADRCAARGATALDTFRRFRRVAGGEAGRTPGDATGWRTLGGDQFHRGRTTDLPDRSEEESR